MAKVTKIPATISRYTSEPIGTIKKRRVAAYARVSTDHEEQLTSYEAQVDYYTNYIKNREDWEFVNVYADEGVTGCNTKKRDGFNAMVRDALEGRIDLIITKSVSRFARNTVDSLTTIRKLKEHNIECYFEKENIWTFDGKGELLITIMSSLAQEESRSISENCTWGQRKRFADGKVSVPFGRFMGYDRGENGELIVNEEEAEVVRFIYGQYLKGYSTTAIVRQLKAKGIKSPGGKENWSTSCIRSILTNEKYKGDALLQKTYTIDFLTKKKKHNEGEVPQYYVENNHEAIISDEVFDMVQNRIAASKARRNKANSCTIFSGKIICGDCGGYYGSKVWHSTDKYRKVVFRCNSKFSNETKCQTPTLTEEKLKEIFVTAFNKLLLIKPAIIEKLQSLIDEAFRVDGLTARQAELEESLNTVAETVNELIQENARVAQDQNEYTRRYIAATEEYVKIETELNETKTKIRTFNSEKQQAETFIKTLKLTGSAISQFDADLFVTLVENYKVYNNGKIEVCFKNGIEVEVNI